MKMKLRKMTMKLILKMKMKLEVMMKKMKLEVMMKKMKLEVMKDMRLIKMKIRMRLMKMKLMVKMRMKMKRGHSPPPCSFAVILLICPHSAAILHRYLQKPASVQKRRRRTKGASTTLMLS
ncbi:unnamed protein product [Pleuronectes platessa]|uniref:Uncharacterized protein n=1 Tax=Pleuronectes platessa TaxID=8262 RepID=A0A9N7ULH5_PLEPL|nr:unnamed protein product [Pleuronectes platessa]